MKNRRLMLVQMRDDDFMRDHEQQVFARASGVPLEQWTIVDARTDELPASLLDGVDAMFVGGSGEYSVAKGAPFVDRLGRFMRFAVDRKLPTLGVCFGFHVLALAYGAPVKSIEASSETGTFLIER
ncbi:MAG TPA: type 1 glutamine amidotransferase, partial [Candidatus Xenobia bacterium]